MTDKTYYDIIEISPNATQEEIKEAYRVVASVWHPDRFQHGTKQWERANEKLKQINEAYAVLKDSQKRAEYDRLLTQQRRSTEAQPPSSPRFTPEQERIIERNRERYCQALRSSPMRKFCEALQLEDARRKALVDLENYKVELAQELLSRFNSAGRK